MSDFGPPPGPSGPSGPSGPPGPPPGASGPRPAAKPAVAEQQVAILTYAAAALGVLSFVWGFLDWYGNGPVGVSGYSATSGPAGAIVGLALVAGLMAAAATFEKKELGVVPAAVAVAGLLVAFGVLVGHGDTADTKIGLILAFITAIVQAAALVVAWLMATGKLAALGGGGSSAPSNQWQQGPGQQGPGQFGGFAGEQGQYGPPGPPPGYGPPPSQESAPSYGPPPGPPSGYGRPPSQESAPSFGPPPGPPSGYGPPSGPPPSAPTGPPPSAPPSDGDDASRTQVLPRFQPDQNSTQQGIPIFDPQARPDERPGEQEPPSYGR